MVKKVQTNKEWICVNFFTKELSLKMGNAHNFRTEGKLTTSAKINLPS
jgi:hypothetical protein